MLLCMGLSLPIEKIGCASASKGEVILASGIHYWGIENTTEI